MNNIDQVIVLKHHSFTLKTAVLKQMINHFDQSLEVLCSPYGSEFLEGIIIRDKSLAIISDNAVTREMKRVREVDLINTLSEQEENLEFATMKDQLDKYRQKAYEKLARALCVHDDLEAIYIQEMDFKKADLLADVFIKKLLKGIKNKNRTPHIYHRFFGTNTDEGPINHLPQIIDHISQRVYIKGRAGTGKSYFMKKVAQACVDKGFDVEKYHCSFDPDSIDMIITPDLDLCVFDSTAPHEFLPEKDGDVIIDLYEKTVTPGTDEKYIKEINHITQKYRALLHDGVNCLKEMKLWLDQLELPYQDFDKSKLSSITARVIHAINHPV
jgi:hypothetical protein